jgi:hypothetical protein
MTCADFGLDAQAIFRRRRHQPRRPPLAKIRPGNPARAKTRFAIFWITIANFWTTEAV